MLTCGNYDAILGRVVNFSWTFNKDDSYDITVIIRSLGDVIESLKANVLTTSPEQISDSDNLTGVLIAQQTSQTTGVVGIGGGDAQQQDQARRNILGQLPSNQLVVSSPTTTTVNTNSWKDYLKINTS